MIDPKLDYKLIPEGLNRCSFCKFLIWIIFLGIFVLWGIVAVVYILWKGLGVTNLNNYFGFGLWITVDLAVIALGAGAFFSGFLRYIIGIEELKNIINLTVIVGFLCYSGAMMILALDIGQPLRSWFGYWHPNVHSMLTEVIFCITCYLIVLTIEYTPIILENPCLNKKPFLHYMGHNFHVFMPLFAAIGTFLSFFHQGSLGGLYGVLFGRPFALREGFFIWPWTFFLFVLSAVASGPVFILLILVLMEKITNKKLVNFKTKVLLGKISGFMLSIYIFFKIIDTVAWAKGLLPRLGYSFDQMYNEVYGQWLLWIEIGICGILPAFLLMISYFREKASILYFAGFLTCVGVVINRFVFTVQTLAIPVMPFDRWYTYIPNWTEWATTFMMLAIGVMVVSISYRYLPLFPQEKKLN